MRIWSSVCVFLLCVASCLSARAETCQGIIDQAEYYTDVIDNYIVPVVAPVVLDYVDGAPYPDCEDAQDVYDAGWSAYLYIAAEWIRLGDLWETQDCACEYPELVDDWSSASSAWNGSLNTLFGWLNDLASHISFYCP